MRSEDKTRYEFGDFRLDSKDKLLWRGEQIVPLSPKVFETLLLLVEHGGRVVSKEHLIEHLWADSFVEEGSLTQNISILRKKLGTDIDERHFIETLPKRGYRFRGKVEISDTEIVSGSRVNSYIRGTIEKSDDEDKLPENVHAVENLPNNLILPSTAIIGREREISEIENLLFSNRLITLTGIGGTGKTRLAQEISCRMLSQFSDGVFFIPLAAVKNAEFVVSEIAKSLGVKEAGGKSLIETLKKFLGEKHLLLVIDNFEQIVSAAPILGELLDAAPQLKMLATSRALLHLKSEREFVVPPLDLPNAERNFSAIHSFKSEVEENESVKLFIERSRAVKPNFSLTEDNAPIVAEICRRLEGLPLAIELAAARIKILSPTQILERLESRLKLLTGGAKNLPARQQTMRGAIEWSYDLLDTGERILFERLSVFAGGFSVEAAESVCENSADDGQETIDILNGITSLVENSLLVQAETANDESRFRLLEIAREFALEKLEANGEAEAIRKKHAEFFLKLANKAEFQILSEEGEKWLDIIEEDYKNFRAAFFWAEAADALTAVGLAGSLRDFWFFRSQLTEGREWFERALKIGDDAPAALRFKLFSGLGQAAKHLGDYAASQKAFQSGLAVGKESKDFQQIAAANRGLAAVAKMQGDFAAAEKFYKEGLAHSRRVDEKFGIGVTLNALGDLARLKDDFKTARPLFDEALAICREIGVKQGIGCILNNLGAVAFALDDPETASANFAESLKMTQELGEHITFSYSLDGFAALAVKRGEAERAAQLAGAAGLLRESRGFETEPAERRFRDAYLSLIHAALDEESFSKAVNAGRKMKIEKVIETALA